MAPVFIRSSFWQTGYIEIIDRTVKKHLTLVQIYNLGGLERVEKGSFHFAGEIAIIAVLDRTILPELGILRVGYHE